MCGRGSQALFGPISELSSDLVHIDKNFCECCELFVNISGKVVFRLFTVNRTASEQTSSNLERMTGHKSFLKQGEEGVLRHIRSIIKITYYSAAV